MEDSKDNDVTDIKTELTQEYSESNDDEHLHNDHHQRRYFCLQRTWCCSRFRCIIDLLSLSWLATHLMYLFKALEMRLKRILLSPDPSDQALSGPGDVLA